VPKYKTKNNYGNEVSRLEFFYGWRRILLLSIPTIKTSWIRRVYTPTRTGQTSAFTLQILSVQKNPFGFDLLKYKLFSIKVFDKEL